MPKSCTVLNRTFNEDSVNTFGTVLHKCPRLPWMDTNGADDLRPCFRDDDFPTKSLAQVEARDRNPGTGFIVALQEGRAYVVTCAHVLAEDSHPIVTFNVEKQKRRYQAEVRDTDRRLDLALLVVEGAPDKAFALEARPGPAPPEGADLLVGGYPGETGAQFAVVRVPSPP